MILIQRTLLCVFLIFNLSSFAFAQDSHGLWLGVFNRKALSTESSFLTEAQLRYNTDIGTTQQSLQRFGWLKKISDHQEFGLLGAFVQTGQIKEYRPTLQYGLTVYEENPWKVTTRTRLELRHLETQSQESFRLRSLWRVDYKVSDPLSLVLWNEIFFHLNKASWTANQLVDRHRLFVGLKILDEGSSFEVGYLNQFVILGNQNHTQEHLLVLYLFL